MSYCLPCEPGLVSGHMAVLVTGTVQGPRLDHCYGHWHSPVASIRSLAHGKFSVVSNKTGQSEGELHTILPCTGRENFVIPVDDHLQFKTYTMHVI